MKRIEMKFKNQNYPILIAPTHIPELNAVEHTADGIKFGASVTLSALERCSKGGHAFSARNTRPDGLQQYSTCSSGLLVIRLENVG
ncbi:hypothetical protein OS493_040404, partial [Desmophyllum pertusum]